MTVERDNVRARGNELFRGNIADLIDTMREQGFYVTEFTPSETVSGKEGFIAERPYASFIYDGQLLLNNQLIKSPYGDTLDISLQAHCDWLIDNLATVVSTYTNV